MPIRFAANPRKQVAVDMLSAQRTSCEPGEYGFSVSVFGCVIRFTSSCLEAHSVLQRYVFPSFPRIEIATNQSDVAIRVAVVANAFQLSLDDVVVASAANAMSLVPDIMRVLDDTVIQRLRTLWAVHAGAVLLRGRALLLPGATHAGKSSLVAELLRRGATYFSDEYALIDAAGRVHPYPRPLLLRNGCPDQIPTLPEELNSAIGDGPAPLGWVLSLEYQPETAWSVAEVPQSMALLALLQNTPHCLAESPNMVSAFQSAVAGAKCYAGSRAEACHAVDRILQLVSSPE